jgi:putative ABC transport system permease protein
MTVTERTQEYATLRALGFEPHVIGLLVLGESVLVTSIGTALGLACGLPLLSGIGDFIETNVGKLFPTFRVQPGAIALAIAVSIGFGALSAIVPALRAARTPVANALRRA